MSMLPHLADTLQDLLTTTADALARTTRFVQRRSPLGGAAFVQTLVFGFLANPTPALEELAQTAATLGVPVSAQALDQRFTPVAATYLEQMLRHALTRVLAAAPVAVPVLDRFTAVYLQDSSTIVLPDALRQVWHGCGGTTTTHTAAALKLQVRFDLRTGHVDGPHLQHGRASDHAYSVSPAFPAGSLRLADLGYWSLEDLEALDTQHVFWLSRLQAATTVYDHAGRRWDVLELLAAQTTTQVDLPVQLGVSQRLAARLLAVQVPQEVVDQRRRRLHEDARRKGRAVSATRLAWAAWTILVTNTPTELLDLREALVLARARWQIELLFKLWKSHGQVDESRSGKPWRILCEVYAKLLAMLIQHWVFLCSCWAYPDRSLPKAAQTVRKHALHLASALADGAHLQQVLATIQRCLAAGCRMNRRKTAPNTFQQLLDLTNCPLA